MVFIRGCYFFMVGDCGDKFVLFFGDNFFNNGPFALIIRALD